MKNALFLAAGALLGGVAEAGIHKMKLQKIPLSEQLVCLTPVIFSQVLELPLMSSTTGAHRFRRSRESTWPEIHGRPARSSYGGDV